MVEISSTFELKYAPIDDDHKHLADIVTEIVDALDAEKLSDSADLVRKFVETTRTHFQDEEALLASHNYPHLDKHNAHHATLVQKLETLQDMGDKVVDHPQAADSLRKELIYFLMDDIINEDLNFKNFITEAAAKD